MVKKAAKIKTVKVQDSSKKIEQETKTKNNKKEKKNFTFDKKILLKILPIIFIIFVMWFAFHVRSGPIELNGMDERIEANIYGNIKNIITQQVEAEYPNLSPVYKQEEVDKRFNQVLQTGEFNAGGQVIVVDDYVKQNSQVVKDAFKDENNQTYLNAIDPYHYYGLSYNYAQNGHTGDTLKDGQPWISYKMAPNGVPGSEKVEFHTWLESFLFKSNNINEDSTVGEKTKAIFLIPVIFAMLSAIPIYFIIRRFSNDLFALFGSILLVSVGTFVSRTVAGFVDTDAYNVFFPLTVILFLVYGFVFKNKFLTIVFGAISGLFMGFFIWAWVPGWFIFLFSIIALIGYIGFLVVSNYIIKKDENFYNSLMNNVILFFSFVISSFIFTLVIAKRNIFTLTYEGIFGSITNIAGISGTNIWPNVLSSVAELNPASFVQIVSSVGGKLVFLIAMLGLVFLTLDFKSKNNKSDLYRRIVVIFAITWFSAIIFANVLVSLTANSSMFFLILLFLPVAIGFVLSLLNSNTSNKLFLAMLLGIWMAGTIYMSFNGVRFILLLAPAFAVAFALGLYYIANVINHFITTEFSIEKEYMKKAFGYVAVTILFVVLFIPMANQAVAISNQTIPNFDDAWYSTMYKIRDNSEPTAIITSWWDFGHFFAAISQRGVTFDGGSQTTPQSHWVGKLLMENDEDKAVDILRMLVCGGNNAHDKMLEMTDGTAADAVKINKIIYSTFGKDITQTREIIKNNSYYEFTEEQTDIIMENLACENPREDFLITSEDMVGKAGVWAHWGSWDFTKKYVHDTYKTKTASEIATLIDENETLIQNYIDQLNQIDVRSRSENIKRGDLINQWLAPYPSYIPIQGTYEFPCQRETNVTISCQNSLVINTQTGKITSAFGDDVKFKNLVTPTGENTLSVIPLDEDGTMDVLLIPSGQGYNSMIMQTPLGASTFTKLFYLNGFGTEHFELFDSVDSMTGVKVLTWKVNWNPEEENSSVELENNSSSLEVNSITFNEDNSSIEEEEN